MIQCKIFLDSHTDKLEQQVNEWLSKYDNVIDVIDAMTNLKSDKMTVCIFYRMIEKDTK